MLTEYPHVTYLELLRTVLNAVDRLNVFCDCLVGENDNSVIRRSLSFFFFSNVDSCRVLCMAVADKGSIEEPG